MKKGLGFVAALCGIIACGSQAHAENDGNLYQNLFAPPAATVPDATTSAPVAAPAPAPVYAAPPAAMPPTASAPTQPVDSQTAPPATWSGNTAGPTTGSQLWGSGASTASGRTLPSGNSDGYCDPQIAQIDEQGRSQVVQARTNLATSIYSTLPTGMLHLGCIDRILNSTLNIFGPGGLGNLLGQAMSSFSCERVLTTINGYANQQLSQYTSQAVGAVNNAVGGGINRLGIGEAIPGVSLGALTSGAVNLQPTLNIGGVGGGSYVNLGQSWNTGGVYISNGSNPQGYVTMPSRLLGQ